MENGWIERHRAREMKGDRKTSKEKQVVLGDVLIILSPRSNLHEAGSGGGSMVLLGDIKVRPPMGGVSYIFAVAEPVSVAQGRG